MSCFIVSPETVSQLAAGIADCLNNKPAAMDLYIDDEFKKVFENCDNKRGSDVYSEHKIYRLLYIENLKAWNGRYPDHKVMEFTKYTPHDCHVWHMEQQAELFKRGRCYLYQLDEDSTYNKPVYKAVKSFLDSVAESVAMYVADSMGTPWQ